MRLLGKKKGQSLLIVTIALVPMFGIVGLVTDLGYMYYVKKSAQNAADAAAMAAILQFQWGLGGSGAACGQSGVVCQSATSCSPTPTNYLNSACLYATQNGFSASGNQSVTVAAGIGTPPTASGVYSLGYWVTVRASQTVPQLFMSVMGVNNGTVAAEATAATTPGRDCIWVMAPSGIGLSMNGTTTLSSSCGVFVDSNASDALSGVGGASLTASEIDIVGSYSWHGPISPDPPSTGLQARPDPLAYLAEPSTTGVTVRSSSQDTISKDTTLQPGIYVGGIYVKNATATLSAGTYIIEGGGVATQNANSVLQGSGVTIYNTCSTPGSCGSGSNYAPFSLSGNSTVALSAPTTGTYSGILIMEDRSIPVNTYYDTLGGGSSAQYTGIIYSPRSNVSMYGNASATVYTTMVAYTLSMVGTTYFNNDYSSLAGGNPLKVTALVE
jgi:Flp pilus assembly protein TadG